MIFPTSPHHQAYHMEFLHSVHIQANSVNFHLQVQTIPNIVSVCYSLISLFNTSKEIFYLYQLLSDDIIHISFKLLYQWSLFKTTFSCYSLELLYKLFYHFAFLFYFLQLDYFYWLVIYILELLFQVCMKLSCCYIFQISIL